MIIILQRIFKPGVAFAISTLAWIPAYAGMTMEGTGMSERSARSAYSKTHVKLELFSLHKFQELQLSSSESFHIQWERAETGKKEFAPWPAEEVLKLQIKNNFIESPNGPIAKARSIEIVPTNEGALLLQANGIRKRLSQSILTVVSRQGNLQVLAQVSREHYVATVLVSELPEDFPLEALKAQAVLIRTLASKKNPTHGSEGFNFCDSTHCQLFQPERPILEKFQRAVEQTQGLILTHRGKAIEALYHSTCGGRTAANQKTFGGGALPYLQGSSDQDSKGRNYCAASPHSQWSSTLSLKELRALFKDPSLKNLEAIDLDQDGRAEEILLIGEKTQKILAQDFLMQVGRQLGWSRLKSAVLQVNKQNELFLFTGKGLGHGVGMCQWGARGMALAGQDYIAILKHYFPGTSLQHGE